MSETKQVHVREWLMSLPDQGVYCQLRVNDLDAEQTEYVCEFLSLAMRTLREIAAASALCGTESATR